MIALSGVYFFYTTPKVYTTAFNQTKQVVLPDGSEVMLNANSKLKIPRYWAKKSKRKAWLEGEAFFSILSTPQRGGNSFLVYAGMVQVEVLGTQFNVQNRRGKVDVVLTEGKINLSFDEEIQREKDFGKMLPGQRIAVFTQEKEVRKSEVNTEIHTSWRNQKLFFEETPLSNLVEFIQDYYDYEVIIKDSTLLKRKLSGTVSTVKPEILFESLATAFDLKIERISKNEIALIGKE